MRLGFTGTRKGMTVAQRFVFADILKATASGELHHGDCLGADAGAHSIACDLGWDIIIHPPKNNKARAFCRPAKVIAPPDDFIVRNHHIVDDTEMLVAAPGSECEDLRSGTWATVRYARKLRRPIAIIWPSGDWKVENEFPQIR